MTLGQKRDALVGQPYTTILTPQRREAFPKLFAQFQENGQIEVESEWRTADGEVIDVLLRSTAAYGDGKARRTLTPGIYARRFGQSEYAPKPSEEPSNRRFRRRALGATALARHLLDVSVPLPLL